MAGNMKQFSGEVSTVYTQYEILTITSDQNVW